MSTTTNKTSNFYTIYEPNVSLGGFQYRATSNGEAVHLQEMRPHPAPAAYRTKRTVTQAQWDTFAEKFDVFNPYNDDPSRICNFTNYGPHWVATGEKKDPYY